VGRAQLLDNFGARGRSVSERRLAGDARERVDDLGREAVRVGRKRHGGDDSGHLPMSGNRIFAAASLAKFCDARTRLSDPGHTRGVGDMSDSEPLQIGQR